MLSSIYVVHTHDGNFGLVDIYTQGMILATKWVVNTLEGDALWKYLLTYKVLNSRNINRFGAQCHYVTSLVLLKIS
jgi:hypothetical protein